MKFDTPNFNEPWKISLEDHYQTPDTLESAARYATANKEAWQRLSSNLLDFTKQRVEQMDQTGIELAILSLAPGIEEIYDKKRAVQVARRSNDLVADAMAKNPDRFRAFAALPMQDPDEAIKELIRCVKELGFVGALISGFSQIGEEDTSFYLDIPMYRKFWAEVEKLDVPVYLHPREPLFSQRKAYDGHPWLLGSAWAFGVETATHALRMIGSGLFDEYPKLKIILGHLGEMLPFAIWRWEHRNVVEPRGMKLKKKASLYFYENFFVTTSGAFRTQALVNTILEMGADRVLYSTDYPYESMAECDEWFRSVDISLDDQIKIGRLNTMKLFKLEKKAVEIGPGCIALGPSEQGSHGFYMAALHYVLFAPQPSHYAMLRGAISSDPKRGIRANCSNFPKSAAILQKHEQARFSMPGTSGLGLCGGVENIDANSDPVESPI